MPGWSPPSQFFLVRIYHRYTCNVNFRGRTQVGHLHRNDAMLCYVGNMYDYVINSRKYNYAKYYAWLFIFLFHSVNHSMMLDQ